MIMVMMVMIVMVIVIVIVVVVSFLFSGLCLWSVVCGLGVCIFEAGLCGSRPSEARPGAGLPIAMA